MEIVLGRLTLPPPIDSSATLYIHEQSLLAHFRRLILSSDPSPIESQSHRSRSIEATLLPHCQPFIEAVGHRLAYEAALKHNVDRRLVDLFVASVMQDTGDVAPAEEFGIGLEARKRNKVIGCATVIYEAGVMERMLDALNVEAYIKSPMVTKAKWDEYVGGLTIFGASEGAMTGGYTDVSNELRSDSSLPFSYATTLAKL